MLRAYAGTPFAEAFGRTISELEHDWHAFLGAMTVPPELAVAAEVEASADGRQVRLAALLGEELQEPVLESEWLKKQRARAKDALLQPYPTRVPENVMVPAMVSPLLYGPVVAALAAGACPACLRLVYFLRTWVRACSRVCLRVCACVNVCASV